MGSLLSWQRCGNWNCVFVRLEAVAYVDRMFLTLGSWMGLAINTQSGSSLSDTIRGLEFCAGMYYYVFGHIHLFFIFPQDLEEVLYCTLKKGCFLKRT